MADEEAVETEQASKGGTMKIIMISAIFSLVGIGAGAGVVYFLVGKSSDQAVAASTDGEAVEGEEVVEKPTTPYYFSLDPAFVVNFSGAGRAKFLQVNIDGLTRDPQLKEDITTHLPHIRNNILLLLSSKKYTDLITPEGKESLRQEVLGEMRQILTDETGSGDVEDVFFTSFVMQ